MAIAGDWQNLSQKVVEEPFSEAPLSKGVKKRKYEGQQEDEEEKEAAGETVVRRGWGATTKTYPGHHNANLDDLLSSSVSVKKEKPGSSRLQLKGFGDNPLDQETSPVLDPAASSSRNHSTPDVEDQPDDTLFKSKLIKEESELTQAPKPVAQVPEDVAMPIFKKRRAKAS